MAMPSMTNGKEGREEVHIHQNICVFDDSSIMFGAYKIMRSLSNNRPIYILAINTFKRLVTYVRKNIYDKKRKTSKEK